MLERLSLEDFLPLIGHNIDVDANGQHTQLEIKEVSATNSPSARATPPFHLILRSDLNWRVPQGMFQLYHPELGIIELFAVPIGPDGKGLCYEIIFN